MTLPSIARLALVLGGLCLPAVAGAAGTCPGDHPMADSAKTTIIGSGTGNTAPIVRTNDAEGTLRLEQQRKDHAALAVQSGSGEKL